MQLLSENIYAYVDDVTLQASSETANMAADA